MEESVQRCSRRKLLQRGGAALLASVVYGAAPAFSRNPPELTGERPKPADRRFRSEIVEQYLAEIRARIPDPELAHLTPEQQQSVGNRALLHFGLSMLANSGPSTTPRNFGQIVGAGMAIPSACPQRRAAAVAH